MKILLFFCACIAASAQGVHWDQIRGKPPLIEWRAGSGVPTIPCEAAKVMYLDFTSQILYYCAAANTWKPLVSGTSPTTGTVLFSTITNAQFSGLTNAQFSGLPNN